MIRSIKQFLKSEKVNGTTLIIATILALIMANTPLQSIYQQFLHTRIVKIGILNIDKSILSLINDGLMTIFFLSVGLEIKQELVEGSLAGFNKSILPIIAALGGMLFPALIYLLANINNEILRQGWAIPTATDIVFAISILSLFTKRVPKQLKIFLLALAIIDDLGAIIIITSLYTKLISIPSLCLVIFFLLILILINYLKIMNISFYLIIGVILWLSILKSNIHASLAGVIVGFCVPLNDKKSNSPSKQLAHFLHPWVTFLILPLFAFANAGFRLHDVALTDLNSPVLIGIVLGLLIGKPMGIFLFSWIMLKLGITKLHNKINLKQIFAVSVLCGVGFTMAIFITNLAFHDLSNFSIHARLGIMISSIISTILGSVLLNSTLPKYKSIK